ncbi:hypothetical protein NC99_38070 [Sunxiuqinia dokdonensis]|uniref:Uncharacterized protein n=1 Tax=Sunxiuqinia dokdonensis TaxID=1409788 RepID=A0A0L8V4G3_9BACT|nr:hypothetical protein NC99_38070 [Sunxiuqinia dokdonensis]
MQAQSRRAGSALLSQNIGLFYPFKMKKNTLFHFISMKLEAKINRQLSLPQNWKRKSAVNFHFHRIGNENQLLTFTSTELEMKTSYQLVLPQNWKRKSTINFHSDEF